MSFCSWDLWSDLQVVWGIRPPGDHPQINPPPPSVNSTSFKQWSLPPSSVLNNRLRQQQLCQFLISEFLGSYLQRVKPLFFCWPSHCFFLTMTVCKWCRQEGWRLENENPADPNTPLVFKGVVFNEMKGAFVSQRAHTQVCFFRKADKWLSSRFLVLELGHDGFACVPKDVQMQNELYSLCMSVCVLAVR